MPTRPARPIVKRKVAIEPRIISDEILVDHVRLVKFKPVGK